MGYNNMEEIQKSVPLKGFTSWRVGGEAEFFIRVSSLEALFNALEFAKREGLSVIILGGGSNVLVSDSGVKGLVIKVELKDIWRQGRLLVVDSGYSLIKLTRTVEDSEFCDMSWASGIPGSVGGAVKGNAGAFGGDIASNIEWVEIIRNGRLMRLSVDKCGFSYRKSGFLHSDIIIRAGFKKSECKKEQILAKRLEFAKRRKATQPSGYSAGSVFKNPFIDNSSDILEAIPYKSAGQLIEAVGLKDFTIGDATISEKHANFIINKGSATATDIENLIAICKKRVFEKFGVELVEEIKRW